MKKILSLATLLSLCFYLPAQQIFLEKKMDNVVLTDVAVVHDGYYVLGAHEREWVANNRWNRKYTPFVAKLDGNFNILFEQKFAEGDFKGFEQMTVADDGIWLVGNYYSPSAPKKSQGWLHKMDWNGRQLFDKKMPHSGFHSTEGKGIQVLSNGDVLFTMQLYRNYNSYGHHRLYRFTPGGREIWHKDLEVHKTLSSTTHIIENQDGSLLLTGFQYDTYDDLRNAGAQAWMCHMDGEDPTRVFFNRQYNGWTNLVLNGSLELSDGSWWVIGTDRSRGTSRAVFLEVNRQGNLVRSHEISHEKGMYIQEIAWNPATQRLIFAGSAYGTSATDPYGHLISMDPETLQSEQKTFDKGRYRSIVAFDDGEMLLQSNKKLELIR